MIPPLATLNMGGESVNTTLQLDGLCPVAAYVAAFAFPFALMGLANGTNKAACVQRHLPPAVIILQM